MKEFHSYNPCFIGKAFATRINDDNEIMLSGLQSLFYWKSLCNAMSDEIPSEVEISYNPCFIGKAFATGLLMGSVSRFHCYNPCFIGKAFATMYQEHGESFNKGYNPCFIGKAFAT